MRYSVSPGRTTYIARQVEGGTVVAVAGVAVAVTGVEVGVAGAGVVGIGVGAGTVN